MGCCVSTNEVDKHMKKSQKRHKQENIYTHKLLLLGAGESGKSTIFKQIEYIHGNGFPKEDREAYRDIVFAHVITCMKSLCRNCEVHGKQVNSDNLVAKEKILSLQPGSKIDSKTGQLLKQLWNDPGIRLAFKNKDAFQLFDNADYFLDQLDELMKKNYLPDHHHIFRARVRTTGIVEMKFRIDNSEFVLFDVGGQRNERKKWIHCFESVMAVLFVASLSAYNQKLYEDKKTSRITEARTLFAEVCTSPWFKKTAKILFLNKKDLFVEKIKTIPLVKFFPEYKGEDHDVDASIAFLKAHFESCAETGAQKSLIYTHITTATDTERMTVIVLAVRDIVLRRALKESGMHL